MNVPEPATPAWIPTSRTAAPATQPIANPLAWDLAELHIATFERQGWMFNELTVSEQDGGKLRESC